MILISVCARKGSKGLPGKNERPFMSGGSPLARAMDFAFNVQAELDHHMGERVAVVCSTDIELPEMGTPMYYWRKRPRGLAGDRVHKWLVIRDLVDWYESLANQEVDCILDLDVTRPIRNVEDSVALVKLFLENQPDMAMTISPSKKHPTFDLWAYEVDGSLGLYDPKGWGSARQGLPSVYQWGGEWVIDRSYLLEAEPEEVFSAGMVLGHKVPVETSLDIDDELDWVILEAVGRYLEERDEDQAAGPGL